MSKTALAAALLAALSCSPASAAPRAAPAAAAAAKKPERARPERVRKVAIVLYDGVEILDFAGPAEVLQAAGGFAGHGGASALEVYTVARKVEPLKAQGFVTVVPQYSIDDAPAPDLVVVPGGNSRVLSRDPAMMKWLTETAAGSEATLTVCTGAFPLAEAGAFDGLEITTWYDAIEGLQALAPKARVTHGRRFVDNGRYLTTAGVSAGIDGALHLTARLFGRRVADQTARYMEYHWTPEPYLAARYSYWNPSTDARGRALQAAEQAVEERRWPEAIAQYRKLAAGDRTGAAWVGLGDALFRSGDHAGAAAAYRRVQPGSPSFVTAHYNLACALARSGKEDAALAAIEKAIAAGASREHALADGDLAAIRDRIAAPPR